MNTSKYISIKSLSILLVLFIALLSNNAQAQMCSSPALVSMSVTTQNLRCNGDNSGSISVSITGGATPSYTYSLYSVVLDPIIVNNHPINSYTFSNLPADNNYFLVIQVPIGGGAFAFCSQSISLTQPPPLSISSGTITAVSCNGGADGAIDAVVSGGPTMPYTYSWSNGATTEDISGLTAGNYTLTITDGNGCTLSNTFTVTEPTPVTATATPTQITCNGANNGSIALTPAGGTAPYNTFLWSNGATTQNISGLAPGTYSVTFKDSKGCTGSASATINAAPVPVTATATPTQISCGGLTDGSITLTPAGGTAPYNTFLWSNGATTQNISGLAPGTYSVTFKDSKGCTGSASATINAAPVPVTATATPTQISCGGLTDGSITLTPAGGTAPYNTFLWSNGATTQNISGLAPGTYSVTFKDSKGCTGSASATINAAPVPVTATATPTQISCGGLTDGSITLTPAGGTAPYNTFLWSNGATTQNISGLAPGTYSVTFKDSKGCTGSASATINAAPVPVTATATPTQISCGGLTDGSITLTPAGGTAPYNTFLWSNGTTTQNISGLAPGTYSVTFKDSKGCTGSASATINAAPTPVTATATPTQISCGGLTDGSITLTPAGGTAPYNTFLWSNGATTQNISGLAPGTYSVTFKDSKGCTGSASATINPAPLPVTATATPTQISCGGLTDGSITLTPAGGTAPYNTFLWSNGATTQNISGLAPGTYSVTFKDSKGCTGSASATINPAPLPVTATATPTQISCGGLTDGSITLTPAGGTAPYNTFLWSNGATTQNISGLAPGTYSVTFKDSKGCTGSASATINPAPTPVTATATPTQISCGGLTDGSITLTPAGGTAPYNTFLWSNGATTQNISGLAPGTYSVTFKDSKGCTGSASATINAAPVPVTATATPTQISCGGLTDGSITLTPAGGTAPYNTFLWSNGATTQNISGLAPGTYSVTFKDSKGCTGSASATINAAPVPVTATATPTQISCGGLTDGSITLTPAGGTAPYNTFLWSNGATTQNISGLAPGTYSVTFKDSKGCTGSASATINAAPVPVTATATPTQISCGGLTDGSITLTPAGGTAPYNTFLWSNGATTQNISGLAPGTYSVTFKDSKGCTGSASATINAAPVPVTATATPTQITCNGANNGSITLIPAGGTAPYNTFLWSNAATTQNISGLAPGTYSVTFKDSKGCTGSASATINPAPTPVTATGMSNNATCNGQTNGSIILTPAGGTPNYTYSWSNGTTSKDLTNVGPGTYTVTITDSKGCSNTTPISFTINPTLTVTGTATASANPVCSGQGTTITASINPAFTPAALAYSFNGGSTFQASPSFPIAHITGDTIINVILKDINGCLSNPITVAITTTKINASVNQTQFILCNGSNTGELTVNVVGSSTGFTYSINGGAFQASPVFSNLAAGTYTIVVDDNTACKSSYNNTITQPAPLTLAIKSTTDVNPCTGNSSNGAVTVTANGGTKAYTFKISPSGLTQTDSTFTNLTAGNYTIDITDANGCTQSVNTTITAPSPIAITATPPTDPTCANSAGGAIDITVTGGTPAYTYLWSNGAITQDLTNAVAGTYKVVVTDSKNCKDSITAIINPAPSITGTASASPGTVCSGQGSTITASIDAAFTPAALPYSFDGGITFQASSSFVIASIMGDTAVNVILKDINGCLSNPITVAITTTKITGVSVTQTQSILCNGANTGALTVTGGSTGFTYSINGGAFQASPVFSNLPAGNYTIVVNNGTGCNVSYNSTITQPAVLTLAIKSTTDVNPCISTSNGAIAVTANGGTKAYTFKISPSGLTQTDSTFTNLTAGNYTIDITDANGCTQSVNATITAPSPIAITAIPPTDPTCANPTGGAIDITVTGGTPAYTYLWSNGAITQDLTNAVAGTYKVVVTDSKNCKDSITAIINPAPSITGTAAASPNTVCSGQGSTITASIDAAFTPAALPYSFDGGITFQASSSFVIASIMGDTAVNVILKDINGCLSNPITVAITTTKINASVNQTQFILCNGSNTGELTVNVVGSSTGFTYSINGGAFQASPVFSNLPAGNYTIVIDNGTACNSSYNSKITQPAPLTLAIKSTTDVNPCISTSNGAIEVTANGGTKAYTFKISPSGLTQTDSTFTNLTAGNYTIDITDANGCTQSVNTTITAPAPIAITATPPTDPTCANPTGGAIDITVTGGTPAYTYLWSNGAITQDLTNAVAGTYKVVVTDSKNCKDSITAIINPAPSITGTASASPGTVCSGQGSTITASIDAAFTPAALPYSFDGGITFQASSSFVIASIMGDTAVNVILKDINGCLSNPITVAITTTKINASISESQAISCASGSNGELTVNVVGSSTGFTYSINGGAFQASPVFSNLPAGNYTIVIDNGTACNSSYTATLIDPIPVTIGIKAIVNVSPCAGGNNGSVSVTANGGSKIYSFTLNPSGPTQTDSTFTNLTAGNYTIDVTDAKGCTASSTIASVIQPTGVDTSLIAETIVNNICAGNNNGSIQITNVTGGVSPYTYTLNGVTNNTGFFDKLLSGQHTITITDAGGCPTLYVFTIKEPLPILFATNIIPSSCVSPDGSIEIFNVTGGTPPYKYSINDGATYGTSTLFSGLGSGTYPVRVGDQNGCSYAYSVILPTKTAPVPYIRINQPLCNGGDNGFIVIDSISGGIPLFQYNFNGINVGSSTVYSNLTMGQYPLIITDQACTYNIDSFYVYNKTTQLYDTLSALTIPVGEPAAIAASVFSSNADRYESSGVAGIYNINGGTPGYLWSSDNTLFSRVTSDTVLLNGLSKGNHTIYVVDTNGCRGTFDITIYVEFFIPNLITPNKDGKNDRFEIMALPVGSELLIVNRWGNRVYLSSNYDNSWDADEDSDGVYYYELKLPNGDKHKGWVEVTR